MAQQSGYLPGIAPPATDPELQQALQWSQRELDNISRQFTNFDTVQYNVLHAPPEKPRDGMTVVADGVNWNPGDGPGVYVYQNGAWHKVGGSTNSAFTAYPTGSADFAVPDAVWVQFPFGSLGFDIGGHYDASTYRWTPPAGIVTLQASMETSTVTLNGVFGLSFYKNGSPIRYQYVMVATAIGASCITNMSSIDHANGTDWYTVFGYVNSGGAGAVVAGGPVYTTFAGRT